MYITGLRFLITHPNGKILAHRLNRSEFKYQLPYKDVRGWEMAQTDDLSYIKECIQKLLGESFRFSIDREFSTRKKYTILKYQDIHCCDRFLDMIGVRVIYRGGIVKNTYEWLDLDDKNQLYSFEGEDSYIVNKHLITRAALYTKPKHLYWVTTKDNDENWFIVATNSSQAARFHENYEGYDYRDAVAKKVCHVLKEYDKDPVYHAQEWMLEDLGFSLMNDGFGRVARLNGRVYKEGNLAENVVYDVANDELGLYIVRSLGTSNFKIGVTQNLKQRVSNIQTGNPNQIEIYNYYRTDKAWILERYLHKKYKQYNIGGEWYELDFNSLNQLHKDIKDFIQGTLTFQENVGVRKLAQVLG